MNNFAINQFFYIIFEITIASTLFKKLQAHTAACFLSNLGSFTAKH